MLDAFPLDAFADELEAAIADAVIADAAGKPFIEPLDAPVGAPPGDSTLDEPGVYDDIDTMRLARAVIRGALNDLLDASRPVAAAAYQFLTTPSADLDVWTTLAGIPIDPRRLRRVPLERIRLLKRRALDELVLEAA
jgi:hypothetical protein